MKKAFSFISEAVKMCLNVLMGALCFIKIDHDVAHLPNAEGGIERLDYYYSIYDKLYGKNLQFLVYIALVVMSVSFVMSIVTCVAKDNRKLRIASHVTFLIAAIIFLILLRYSSCSPYNALCVEVSINYLRRFAITTTIVWPRVFNDCMNMFVCHLNNIK